MEHSESIKTFAAAFVKAQAQIEGAVKDKTNPHFKSQYADLSSVMDACKAALNGNGIAVLQAPKPTEKPATLAIETILMHESGEWASGLMEIPLGQRVDPQGFGSALTYARRYALAAMVGVAPEDDDAEAAQGRQQGKQTPPAKQQPAKVPPKKETSFTEAEAKRAQEAIDAAFQERGIAPSVSSTIISGALKKTQHADIRSAGRAWAKHLIGNIKGGMYDSFKAKDATTAA